MNETKRFIQQGGAIMGAFSSIHRFHEAGEGANVNNMEKFGTPAYSLFTSSKVFSLHHHIEVTDANGQFVAHIERKIFTLHERHFVTMANGLNFEVANEIFHIIKDVTNIQGLGWQLRGNILGLNFELYDKDGSVIAVIGQKLISIHDKYCIDIYKPEYEPVVIAILITLQHMIRDRESRNSSSGASNSSSS